MNSFHDVWELTVNNLKESGKISNVAYDMWIGCISPLDLDSDKALLHVPSDFQRNIIMEKYASFIKEGLESVLGFDISLKIYTEEERPLTGTVTGTENKTATPGGEQPQGGQSLTATNPINSDGDYEYTFDTFIVGSSNKFAHAASLAVASNPSGAYNPLFIYGGSGLGKTHLLYAICNEVEKNNSNMNVIYVKGEEFTNELIEAIGKKNTSEFHNKYRVADVLLVDDIQFIGGKESTQEEFFHTFNSLYHAGKQIVLTSDRPPKEIKTLEDRLRTRFEWGLLADVQPPDFETRVAIIRRKAQLLDIHISDEVAEYIANRLKNNIRQLEGAVKKLKAYKLLQGIDPSITLAQNAIRDILSDSQPLPVTIDKILSEVSRTFNVTVEDLKSAKQSAAVSKARQIAIFIVRDITQMSMANIGDEFGGRDHSTIVYAIKKIEKNLNKDTYLKETVDDIIKNIKNN